jgi:hypothetical protein
MLIAHCSLLIAHCSLLIAHCSMHNVRVIGAGALQVRTDDPIRVGHADTHRFCDICLSFRTLARHDMMPRINAITKSAAQIELICENQHGNPDMGNEAGKQVGGEGSSGCK